MTVRSGIVSIVSRGATATSRGPAVAAALLIAALAMAPAPALAQWTGSIRLMLHPTAAPRGELPAERLAQLEAIAGTTLTLTGTTRTGALELAFAE